MKKLIRNTQGTTFIELLMYITIFLVITPIMLSVAINSLQTSGKYSVEKTLNSDGQFNSERIFDLITNAKRINLSNSRLNDPIGKLAVITQGDEEIVIELNSTTQRIEITEDSITSNISANVNKVEQLYFEKIPDNIRDPLIAVGINVRMKMKGPEQGAGVQDYILSANLERGDFDEDGCPDYTDSYPRHASCCGDSEDDGICDEQDNCILVFNPFQQDYDQDNIGDHCDSSAYISGGSSGNVSSLGAFNCSSDEELISLIQYCPPLNSSILKQILLSSSPLSPDVLMALIKEDNEYDDPDDVDCEPNDEDDIVSHGHFQQIMQNSVKFTSEVYDAVVALTHLPPGIKNGILAAHDAATEIAWNGEDNSVFSLYQIDHIDTGTDGEYDTIRYHTPDTPLCKDGALNKTNIFVMTVPGGKNDVDITTETTSGTDITNLKQASGFNYQVDAQGFGLEFNEKAGDTYAFLASSVSCTEQLDAIEFNFGKQVDITSPSPTDDEYESFKYTSYCEGGCTGGCGDVGTGIIVRTILNDKCYLEGGGIPEWCSKWYTFEDNNTDYPAFVGGTQDGEETVYWEKNFKSVLNVIQLENLESIIVTGELSYQNITQFFCDTIPGDCPMEAILVGSQDVELWNYQTDTWEVIGSMNLDGTISDQQTFEVKYDDPSDILEFFKLDSQDELKARIKFHWDGNPPSGSTSAPSFMLIDYFTVHLKW